MTQNIVDAINETQPHALAGGGGYDAGAEDTTPGRRMRRQNPS